MFPRRSAVVKYVSCVSLAITVILLWYIGPETGRHPGPWRRLLQDLSGFHLNETLLRMEFNQLKVELNATYSTDNKTVEEIYGYIQAMKKRVPVNPHKFKYILNPRKICFGKEIFLIAYIHSAPDHYKRRTAIRETWGNKHNFDDVIIRVVFLMGRPKTSSKQDALQMESELYGDIVQEDFVDSYRNLTYKAIEGLKWISGYCRNARYVLKADDDIFVNIFNVVEHLQKSFTNVFAKRLLLCLVWYRMKVMRNPKSKWFLSRDEFKDDYFPTYCSGSAYIMSTDVVVGMYNASLQTPFFWVDDFYITGLLAHKLNLHYRKYNTAYVLSPSQFMTKFTDEKVWRRLTFGHVHRLNDWMTVWNRVTGEAGKKRGNMAEHHQSDFKYLADFKNSQNLSTGAVS